jgi:hypothetical protein
VTAQLADILDDMQHDLGKHLALPLLMLPSDADDDTVREAARTALWSTRRGPTGTVDAERMWNDFRATIAGDAATLGGWLGLVSAIERALAWRARLDDPRPLGRAALVADLSAVGDAIRALRAEVPAETDGEIEPDHG